MKDLQPVLTEAERAERLSWHLRFAGWLEHGDHPAMRSDDTRLTGNLPPEMRGLTKSERQLPPEAQSQRAAFFAASGRAPEVQDSGLRISRVRLREQIEADPDHVEVEAGLPLFPPEAL